MAAYSRHSSHEFIHVHLAVVDIFAHGGLIEDIFDVLHGVGAVVGGEGAGLADGVDVAHVADGRGDGLVLIFDEIVYLFVGGVGSWDHVVLVEVGIVGAR